MHYSLVKCNEPVSLFEESEVIVMADSNPVILGTNITFHCPSELLLIGPNTSTCTENKEWEPDPRAVECKGYRAKINALLHLLHTHHF